MRFHLLERSTRTHSWSRLSSHALAQRQSLGLELDQSL